MDRGIEIMDIFDAPEIDEMFVNNFVREIDSPDPENNESMPVLEEQNFNILDSGDEDEQPLNPLNIEREKSLSPFAQKEKEEKDKEAEENDPQKTKAPVPQKEEKKVAAEDSFDEEDDIVFAPLNIDYNTQWNRRDTETFHWGSEYAENEFVKVLAANGYPKNSNLCGKVLKIKVQQSAASDIKGIL